MGKRHEELFQQYVAELWAAKEKAEAWWAGLIENEMTQSHPSEFTVTERWPAGPAAHPYVIAVLRKYYLACEELNKKLWQELKAGPPDPPHVLATGDEQQESSDQVEGPISPRTLLDEGLLRAETQELAAFVARLNYWPIGIDQQGNKI